MKLIKLIDINLTHEYFVNSNCKTLDFVPTGKTRIMAENQGLVFRRDSKGLSIYAESAQDNPQQVNPGLDLNFHLCFELYANDPHFLNYTNLPLDSSPVYYLSNLNIAAKQKIAAGYIQATMANQNQLLHNEQAVSIADQIKIRPPVFDLRVEQTPIVINHALSGNKLKELTEGGNAQIDLKHWGDGWYSIDSPEGNETFYASSNKLLDNGKLIGIVEIFNDPELVDNPCLSNNGAANPRMYQINFEGRSTYWKYVVKNSGRKEYKQLDIVMDGGTTFQTTENEGNDGWFSISNELLAMKERVENSPSLVNSGEGTNGSKVLIEKLPSPSVDIVKTSPDGKGLVSEMFVDIS